MKKVLTTISLFTLREKLFIVFVILLVITIIIFPSCTLTEYLDGVTEWGCG